MNRFKPKELELISKTSDKCLDLIWEIKSDPAAQEQPVAILYEICINIVIRIFRTFYNKVVLEIFINDLKEVLLENKGMYKMGKIESDIMNAELDREG